MRFRYTLKHYLPVEALQFTNNEFEVSISGWDQLNNGSEQGFTWNNPSSVIADASVSGYANTAAIGQQCPFEPETGWPPGTYTVAITATNTSTGGSSPFVSGLNIYGSENGTSLDDAILYDGDDGSWTVGAGESTQQVVFTTGQHYQKIFFKFTKQGVNSGYEVIFTIDSIELIRVNGATNDHEISEPDGWKGSKIILERDPEFCSLVEHYEGAAGGAFIFYGSNGVEDGGIEFIKEIEETYGFDADIGFLAEFAPDDVNYETIFEGLLALDLKNEMKDNKMQVPVIPSSLWAKFINRMNTPVNLSDNFDLDGNPVDPCIPSTVTLTDQKVMTRDRLYQEESVTIQYNIPDSQYGGIDFYNDALNEQEISEKFTIARLEHTERPTELYALEYGGDYTFDIEIRTATSELFGSVTDAGLEVRLQINDDAATVLTQTHEADGLESWTNHNYAGTLSLNKGDFIRLYFYNNNAAGASYQFVWFANVLRESHLIIDGNTEYPATQAQGYLIHDLINGVLDRIGCGRQAIN